MVSVLVGIASPVGKTGQATLAKHLTTAAVPDDRDRPFRNRDRPFRAATKSVTIGRNDRSCLAGIAGHTPPECPVTIGRNTQ
ncbi:MAG: hypothetical protein KA745_14840, partial [Gemmatimonadales bacterium]|nr:hypothetical protein [Gemmatimonadales bacterium]